METTELQTLIRKIVAEQLVKENLNEFEQLEDGVSVLTTTGNAWFKTVSALRRVAEEMNDFRSLYSPSLHGPLPNTNEGMAKLQQIVQLLSELKPIILAMDNIQKKDR